MQVTNHPAPTSGRASFTWPVRVYFEDTDAGGTLIALEPEQVYPLQHGDGGMGNNSITLEQGLWSFLVKVDPTQTSGEVGSVIIQECSAK